VRLSGTFFSSQSAGSGAVLSGLQPTPRFHADSVRAGSTARAKAGSYRLPQPGVSLADNRIRHHSPDFSVSGLLLSPCIGCSTLDVERFLPLRRSTPPVTLQIVAATEGGWSHSPASPSPKTPAAPGTRPHRLRQPDRCGHIGCRPVDSSGSRITWVAHAPAAPAFSCWWIYWLMTVFVRTLFAGSNT
jgi:hypothetical protein